jgi:hypothetical protein
MRRTTRNGATTQREERLQSTSGRFHKLKVATFHDSGTAAFGEVFLLELSLALGCAVPGVDLRSEGFDLQPPIFYPNKVQKL